MGCSKGLVKNKKGLWSPDEDQKLRDYMMNYGHGCWTTVPINAGLQRNGKSCRLRWINYLRPGLKRGSFSMQEEDTILALHAMLGNKWSQISQHLPGRTDNEIKNYWHSYLKKKIGKSEKPKKNSNIGNEDSSPCNSMKLQVAAAQNQTMEMEGSYSSNIVFSCQKELADHQNSNLPKLFFADWLGLDQFHGQDLLLQRTSDQLLEATTDHFGHGANYDQVQDMCVPDLSLINEEASFDHRDVHHQGLTYASDVIIYDSHFNGDLYGFTCGDNLFPY